MKLYFSPGACSLSPHIALREAGLAFDLEQVDLATKKTKAGADFTEVNPKGMMPVLRLDDGTSLTEGPAIVQYIADKAPASGLAPANGTIDRYRLQEWLNYITSELHKGFTLLFKANTPDDYKPIAKENLAARFDYLNRQLAGRQ
jgi:glutathione S-transferase